MDVRMPDGTVVRNVPEGTTKAELSRRYGLSQQQTARAQPDAVDQIFAPARQFFRGGQGPTGVFEGATGGAPGLFGDAAAVIRSGLANLQQNRLPMPGGGLAHDVLSLLPTISRDPALPTSTETINKTFGETTDPGRLAGRLLGSALAPIGAKAGALEESARIAALKDAAMSTARQAANSPAGRAQEILARALERDKLSPENAAQALRQFGDKPLTVADVAGNATARKARLVNTLEGEGSDTIAPFLANRQFAQHGRVVEDIATNLAQGGDPYEMAKTLRAERSAAAQPLYEAAFSKTTPVWNNRLQEFLDDPITKEGMARGLKIQRLEALAEGRPFDPKAYGIVNFNAAGDPIIGGTPNLRLLDAVKSGLDDILEGYRDGTTGRLVLDRTGQAVEKVRKSYVRELDSATANLVPEYKAAREAWSGPTQSAEALGRGGDFLNMSTGQIKDVLNGMSPGDQEFFRIGASQRLRDLVDKTRDNLDAVPRIFGDKATRDRVTAVFGKGAADRMAQSMDAERMMRGTNEFVRGGSNTMNKAADIAEGAGGVMKDVAKDVVKGAAVGGPYGAVALPTVNLAERGAASYIDRIFNNMPPAVRGELAKLLTATGPDAQRALSGLLSNRTALQNARVVPGGGANIPLIDPRILAALLAGSGASKMSQQRPAQ